MRSSFSAAWLVAVQIITSKVFGTPVDTSPPLSDITKASLAFEQTMWAHGSVLTDPWYSVDKSTAPAAPGTLLKVEKVTDASLYTLPPATSLSRFIYQSKTFNGTLVPVSAYILWPHTIRADAEGYLVVAWAHGSSGAGPNCAPSHLNNLWQHYLAPFQLALQGYVVVATDYAGLGVSKDSSNANIPHEFLTAPSQANDVFYAVQAARMAFPEFSENFVIAGHSQGGGVAWAAAQRQAVQPVQGYLGAVAIAPVTSIIGLPDPPATYDATAIVPSIQLMFPAFKPSDILTSDGIARLALSQQVGGNTFTTLSIVEGYQLTKPTWPQNPYVLKYQDIVRNGGKAISGPLLVIHGEADLVLDIKLTTAAVQKTASLFPKASIEYHSVSGTSHNAALTSCQWIWMDWIANRFQGIPAAAGLKSEELTTPIPESAYQIELNWWVAPATAPFEDP